MYNLELAKPRQQGGYDGRIGTPKIQVKINNCPIGTPVRLDEPLEYDELIVVLGPNSLLRPKNIEDEIIFYKYTREEALNKFKTRSGKYIGGRDLFCQGHDKVLSLTSAASDTDAGNDS